MTKLHEDSVLRIFLLWLLLLISLSSLALSATPALTINSPDGDLIDCINIKEQPAFRNPLLKNHIIQEAPTFLPDNVTKSQNNYKWQIWHESGLQCPEGTIPIRRINKTATTEPGVEATKGHEYALAGLKQPPPKIYGTRVTMNVWQPEVEQVDEFSLGQVWVTSGSYNNNELNSIEAGWQVFPELYKDYKPRLFIFWTTDAYTLTTCYNLRCPGFIQISRSVVIEGSISPTSTLGGAQTELTIQIWKDPNAGPWWLAVGFNNGTNLTVVGYWPTQIFTRLTEYAKNVKWGGEIVNRNVSGRHTTTQMGSGYRAGNDKAAYMRDLQIAVNLRVFQPTENLVVGATNASYYNVEKYSNTSFAYGGPGHAGAVHLESKLFYFCFGIFLLF